MLQLFLLTTMLDVQLIRVWTPAHDPERSGAAPKILPPRLARPRRGATSWMPPRRRGQRAAGFDTYWCALLCRCRCQRAHHPVSSSSSSLVMMMMLRRRQSISRSRWSENMWTAAVVLVQVVMMTTATRIVRYGCDEQGRTIVSLDWLRDGTDGLLPLCVL